MKNGFGLHWLLLFFLNPLDVLAGVNDHRSSPDQFAEVVLSVEGMT